MVKMSRRNRLSAMLEIRSWSTEQLQKFLTDQGLGECCAAISKRDVDGQAFLTLTDGQLAFWKRDLNLANIRKLVHLVQDVNVQPEKYVQADSNVVGHGKVSAVDVPCDVDNLRNKRQAPSVSGTRTALSDSWDTDFSDDGGDDDGDSSKACSAANPGAAQVETEAVCRNSKALENEETHRNSEVLASGGMYRNGKVLEKPPLPSRPAVLLPKPPLAAWARSNSHSLPKPPVHEDSVRSLVNNLILPEHNDQFDEEYESVDDEVLARNTAVLSAQHKMSQNTGAQAAVSQPPVHNTQPNQQMENVPSQIRTVKPAVQVSKFPQQTTKVHAVEGHIIDGYISEEYESINENVQSVVGGADEYLQPVQITQRFTEAPSLPPKPLPKLAAATVPFRKPPSLPVTKSGDATSSPGNPGDGGRKNCNPVTSSAQDSKERAPTPKGKELTFPSNSRPLPPTPWDGRLRENSNAVLPRTILQQLWYHSVSRREAEEMLRNGEDGSFLVRPSSKSQNPLTLTLWYQGRTYNIGVRQRSDGRCALGTEKANEQSFASVEDLIQNYQSEKLLLFSGGEKVGRTLLKTSPPQGYQRNVLSCVAGVRKDATQC